MKKNKFGLVIPTFNDEDNFKTTFHSIRKVLNYFDIAIIDSSSNNNIFNFISKFNNINYYKIPPKGVYNALNYGIKKLKNEYIISVNSGDKFESNNFLFFLKNNYGLLNHYDMIVFSQIATIEQKPIYKFKPNINTLFPHQSVIYKKIIHDEIGYFSEHFKLISDQIFFNKTKLSYKIKFVDLVLTTYDLNGLSSKVSLRNIREWKVLNNTLKDQNLKNNLIFYLKIILKILFYPLRNLIFFHKLKINFNSNYSEIK